MDREKVITHLQIIHTWAEFARERDLQFFTAKHLEDIAQWADDALAMLIEQEAVQPNDVRKSSSCAYSNRLIGYCKKCGEKINSIDNRSACGKCGQAVK